MRLPQSSRVFVSFVYVVLLLAFGALLPFRAQAETEQLQCSSTQLKFGTVPVGQSESQLVTLTNTGQTSVTISAINVVASEFSASGLSLPAVLAAGQTVSLNINFSPAATGWFGANVTVKSNASNPNLRIQLAGSGVTTDALTALPSSLSFGQITVGNSSTLGVTLTNDRSWNETLTSFQVFGSGYTVSGPTLPFVLNSQHSVTLNVTFTPQGVGTFGGSIFVPGPNLNIPLLGTGSSIGQLTISPTALNFGNVTIGSSTTQTATLSATGGSVIVSSAASNNSQYVVSGASFPFTINSGQSATLYLVFAPTQSGTDAATLTVVSNASDSQATESLTGFGTLQTYSVSLSWTPSTSSVTGYNVYRGPAVGSYSKINTALDPNTQYTDSTVVAGTTYYYAATAVNSSGEESSYSTPIEVVIP